MNILHFYMYKNIFIYLHYLILIAKTKMNLPHIYIDTHMRVIIRCPSLEYYRTMAQICSRP